MINDSPVEDMEIVTLDCVSWTYQVMKWTLAGILIQINVAFALISGARDNIIISDGRENDKWLHHHDCN